MSDGREAIGAAVLLIGSLGPDVDSVWRHRKGGTYQVIANAIREADAVPLVVYRESPPEGVGHPHGVALTWARPLAEFLDGRFARVK